MTGTATWRNQRVRRPISPRSLRARVTLRALSTS